MGFPCFLASVFSGALGHRSRNSMDELGAVGESRLVPGTLFFSLVFFLRECRFAVVEWVTGLALPGLDSPKHKVLAPGLLGGGG